MKTYNSNLPTEMVLDLTNLDCVRRFIFDDREKFCAAQMFSRLLVAQGMKLVIRLIPMVC